MYANARYATDILISQSDAFSLSNRQKDGRTDKRTECNT